MDFQTWVAREPVVGNPPSRTLRRELGTQATRVETKNIGEKTLLGNPSWGIRHQEPVVGNLVLRQYTLQLRRRLESRRAFTASSSSNISSSNRSRSHGRQTVGTPDQQFMQKFCRHTEHVSRFKTAWGPSCRHCSQKA